MIKTSFMGATRTEQFSNEDLRNADLARAISTAARINILRLLYENERQQGEDFKKATKLKKTTVYHHLETLKEIGLICGGFSGTAYFWYLNPDQDEDLQRLKPFILKDESTQG